MGVPGLRTYASKRLVAKHRLRNAILVIDGLSLQQDLYRRHLPKGGSAQPFGGDYNRFAATVEAFFRALLQAGVTPVVILDGSVPPEKLATKLKRFNAQLAVSKAVYDGRPTGGVINALLNPELFVQILKKLKITVHTAILEADDILPTIARDLGATLLSGDSDFLLADIPGGVISPMSLLAHNMLLHHDHRQDRPYLPCKIYRISRLLAKYRGLTLELAPLAGPLVGNDYIDGSKTNGLVGRLPKLVDTCSSSSSSYNQPKIETVFSWLATQTSVASAVANLKRLARSPSGHHPAIAFIESHFIEPSPSPLETTVSTKGQSEEEYFSANAHRLFSNLEPDIPAWAFKNTSGPLKRRLLTIFTSQLDFASPLVEDLSLEESSHEAAFELCQYIYGLLRRGDDDAHPKVITRYVRVGQQRAEQKVAPKTVINGRRLPKLADIAAMDRNDRIDLFYDILGLSPAALSTELQQALDCAQLKLLPGDGASLFAQLRTALLATVYLAQHLPSDLSLDFLYALLVNLLLMGNYARRRRRATVGGRLLKLTRREEDQLVDILKAYNCGFPARRRAAYRPHVTIVHQYNAWQAVLHNILLLASVLNLADVFHVDTLLAGLQGTFLYRLAVDLNLMVAPMDYLAETLLCGGRGGDDDGESAVFALFESLVRLVMVNGKRHFLHRSTSAHGGGGGDQGGGRRQEEELAGILPDGVPSHRMAVVFKRKAGKRYFVNERR